MYILTGFHGDWIGFLDTSSPVMIIAPRGYLKSTIINDYILRDVLYSPSGHQHQAIIITDNDGRCRETGLEYRRLLQSPAMQDLFGGIDYEQVADSIYIKRIGCRWRPGGGVDWDYRPELTTPTIGIYTVETSRTGIHIDHGIAHFDDAYVSARASTPAHQANRKNVIQVGWLPVLGPNTKIIVSGTRYTVQDEYGRMEEEGIATNLESRSAILPDGTALWPEVWPLDKLEARRKEMGETAFRLQYQNDPTALIGAVFRPELVAAAEIGAFPPDLPTMRVVGVDMAYGGPDYTAAVEVAKHGPNIYVTEAWQRRFESYVDKYYMLQRACAGKVAITEANGPQRDAYDTMRERGLHVIAYPHPLGKSKVQRITETLQPLLEQGRLKIGPQIVIEALLNYSGDATQHDDLLDALTMAVWYADTRMTGLPAPARLSNIALGARLPLPGGREFGHRIR